MPVADNEGNKQRVESIEDLKPSWPVSVFVHYLSLSQTLFLLHLDFLLQYLQNNCRSEKRECLTAPFVEKRKTLEELQKTWVEERKTLEAKYEWFTEMRKSIEDKDADAELSKIEQEFRSRINNCDKTSSRISELSSENDRAELKAVSEICSQFDRAKLKTVSEICSQFDRAKLKGISESFERQLDSLQLIGTDRETLQLHQQDLQAQIDSLREFVSTALQSFLQDPDSSVVDFCDLLFNRIKVPEEAQKVALSGDLAILFNTFFGKEQLGFELHVAPEYVQLSHSIVDNLIYVLECRKPADVTASVVDSERLRRAARSVQRLLGTTLDRAETNEFGHLMQEVMSDLRRFFRYDLEQSAKAPGFAESLSIDLDTIGRQISRSGQKGEGLNAVRLTQENWDLLTELVAAGKHGITAKQLAEKLNVSEGELITWKAALKYAIASLDLTIPGREFRLTEMAAHGERLAWADIVIDEASHQMSRKGKKYQRLPAEFPKARSSEPWVFATRLIEAAGNPVDFSRVFPKQSQQNLRQIKSSVSRELRKLDIAVESAGTSTWKAVNVNPKREL